MATKTTNILGSISIAALLGSAYVAYQNQERYIVEIDKTKVAQEELAKGRKRLTDERDLRDKTKRERLVIEEDNRNLTKDKNQKEDKNREWRDKIAVATKKRDENKTKLDEVREKTAKVGDLNQLASKMNALKAEIEELDQNTTSANAKLANLNQQNTTTDGNITSMRTKFDIISRNQSLPDMKTKIRSIFPEWGFVTLASGNMQGVVTGSTLDVVRGESVVAKLLVTAVERNSSTATIIPDSLAKDVTLMVGDQVIPVQKTTVVPATKK